MDAVARIRRVATSESNVSSGGNEYSSLKNGCIERFSEGDGDLTMCGVEEWLDPEV